MVASYHIKSCHNHTLYYHTEVTEFVPPEWEGFLGQSMEMPYLRYKVPFINT